MKTYTVHVDGQFSGYVAGVDLAGAEAEAKRLWAGRSVAVSAEGIEARAKARAQKMSDIKLQAIEAGYCDVSDELREAATAELGRRKNASLGTTEAICDFISRVVANDADECSICSRPTVECPYCGNSQYCANCDHCRICGPRPKRKVKERTAEECSRIFIHGVDCGCEVL